MQWGEGRLTSLVFLQWNTKKSVQIDDMQKIMRDKFKVDPNIPNIEYFVEPSGWFLLWSTFAANIVYWTYTGQPKYIDNTRFHFPIYPFHMILYFDVTTNIEWFDNTPESRRSGKENQFQSQPEHYCNQLNNLLDFGLKNCFISFPLKKVRNTASMGKIYWHNEFLWNCHQDVIQSDNTFLLRKWTLMVWRRWVCEGWQLGFCGGHHKGH